MGILCRVREFRAEEENLNLNMGSWCGVREFKADEGSLNLKLRREFENGYGN